MSRWRLHPVPLLAGVLLTLLALQLGNWQVRRAAEKTALQASFESASHRAPAPLGSTAPDEWQLVTLRGEWRADQSILLDNRVHAGRAGYHVFSPLERADGKGWTLVNRGWIAANADRTRLPEWQTPSGEVAVTGRVRHVDGKAFTLGPEEAGPVRQVLDLAAYRALTGLPVADFYVQQTSPAEDGLVRDWPQPDAGVERHQGYALQWYALAMLAAGLTGWYAWKGLRRRQGDPGLGAALGRQAQGNSGGKA